MSDGCVQSHVEFCLENAPALLHAIELMLGSYEAAGRVVAAAAEGDDAAFEAMMADMGAHDLGEVLGVIRDRISTVLGGTGGEVEADEAAGFVAVVAGWHAEDALAAPPAEDDR